MNPRSAPSGTSKPTTQKPNHNGGGDGKFPSPRIIQQLQAQQRQQPKLEFPQIVVNDQPLGLNITAASQTVVSAFPHIQGHPIASNASPRLASATPETTATTTIVQGPSGNKSPRVIVYPPNNNLNLSSVISADKDEIKPLGELAPATLPQRKLDGPVTDSDVIYNETRLAAMLAKQKQREIDASSPFQGVQGRSDGPGIQYRDRPKSAVSSRKQTPGLPPRTVADGIPIEAQPQGLAIAKPVELADRGARPSSGRQNGLKRSPREKAMKDPLVPRLQIHGSPNISQLTIQGNMATGRTDNASVHTSARETESVRQFISESLQQYYEQQEANHPSIFEGIAAGLAGDDGSTINTIGGGSFPAHVTQQNSNQWRELFDQHQQIQHHFQPVENNHQQHDVISHQHLPDGPLVPGIAIEDMDSNCHSLAILIDDNDEEDSPRLPQGSVEAKPISPLPARAGSIEEFLSQELGSRPGSPAEAHPATVNLANMVKDMLYPEDSLQQKYYHQQQQQYQHQLQQQAMRGSVSSNLKKGILPRQNHIHKVRPLSSNSMRGRPRSANSTMIGQKSSMRPSTASGESRSKARYLPELYVPTAQPKQQSPPSLEAVLSGAHLGVGETLMDTISELFASQNNQDRQLSAEQIRERLKRPLSPREAVMLMSHEILQRKEEIRREKLWNEKRSEIPVVVVAPQIEDYCAQQKDLSNEERQEPMLPNELKHQMDRQLQMYRKMTNAPSKTNGITYDWDDLTQSQVLRVLATEPVPPRSVSPPQMRKPLFLFSRNQKPEFKEQSVSVHETSLQESSKVVRFAGDNDAYQPLSSGEGGSIQETAPAVETSPRGTAMRAAMVVNDPHRKEALALLQQRYSNINKEPSPSSPLTTKSGEYDDCDDEHEELVQQDDELENNGLENQYIQQPQSPNEEDEKIEIGLKWRHFLLSNSNPKTNSDKAMPTIVHHFTTNLNDPNAHLIPPVADAHNHITVPRGNDVTDENDQRLIYSPRETYAGSLLESALPAVRNEAFYVDNYDPSHLLKSPELMAGQYVDPNANQSRPVSRGNYLYSYYKEQQDRLKKQYERPQSGRKPKDESSPNRPISPSPRWGPLPHEVKMRQQQRRQKQDKNAVEGGSGKEKGQTDIVDHQNDIVKLNMNVASDRVDANFKLVNVPLEATKVLLLNIPTYQQLDESDDDSLYGPKAKKIPSNNRGNKARPESPKNGAMIPDDMLPVLVTSPSEKEKERNMKEEERVKSLLATTSLPLHSKKEEMSSRNNALKYSKYIANRNKENKSVSWSKSDNPAKIAKQLEAPVAPQLTPLPPSGSSPSSSKPGESVNRGALVAADALSMNRGMENLNIAGAEALPKETNLLVAQQQ